VKYNNAINADSKKRRSFVAPLFAAGYGERYVPFADNTELWQDGDDLEA